MKRFKAIAVATVAVATVTMIAVASTMGSDVAGCDQPGALGDLEVVEELTPDPAAALVVRDTAERRMRGASAEDIRHVILRGGPSAIDGGRRVFLALMDPGDRPVYISGPPTERVLPTVVSRCLVVVTDEDGNFLFASEFLRTTK